MDVADAGPDLEGLIDAGPRDFVPDNHKLQRIRRALARHIDVNRRPLGAFQQVHNPLRGQPFRGCAVHPGDDVARTQAGFVGRRTWKRRAHQGLAAPLQDGHAHPVILALALLAQHLEALWIDEVGVRIERSHHPGDGPVVDGFVGIDRVGVILLDHGVNLGQQAEVFFDVRVIAAVHFGGPNAASKHPAHQGAKQEHGWNHEVSA